MEPHKQDNIDHFVSFLYSPVRRNIGIAYILLADIYIGKAGRMHHISFLRGTVDGERDRYRIELQDSETGERIIATGRISEVLEHYDPGTVEVEQVGNAVAEIHKRRGQQQSSY
jgi:hypothetical protein